MTVLSDKNRKLQWLNPVHTSIAVGHNTKEAFVFKVFKSRFAAWVKPFLYRMNIFSPSLMLFFNTIEIKVSQDTEQGKKTSDAPSPFVKGFWKTWITCSWSTFFIITCLPKQWKSLNYESQYNHQALVPKGDAVRATKEGFAWAASILSVVLS